MSGIKCHFLEPTNRAKQFLRRYCHSSLSDAANKCPLPFGYHNASTLVATIEISADEIIPNVDPGTFPGSPFWPRACGCGYVFSSNDEWQVSHDRIYVRQGTGEELGLREARVGDMWDASWYPDSWKGPDGRSLICMVPTNHHWHIDGRASNCTMPEDSVHRCWVRHGEPPNLTVDKNGVTCAAGAGSIQTADWHGFLRDGFLVT